MKHITIRYRYANTFAFRAVCKHCGEGPDTAYFVLGKDQSRESAQHLLRRRPLNQNSFLKDSYVALLTRFRKLKVNAMFNTQVAPEHSTFAPDSKMDPPEEDVSCRMECPCGETCWQFEHSDRAHVSERKAQKSVPVSRTRKVTLQ